MRPDTKTACAVLTTLLGSTQPVAAFADSSHVGLSLDAAIRSFEQQGHQIFYSSDLVRPWMQVESEPLAPSPAAALDEMLAPHGLKLRRGLNESWLIVRAPRPAPVARKSPRPAATTRQVAPPEPLPVERLIVAASRYELRRAQSVPRLSITDFDLEYLPDLGDDSMRAVARLPGMASNGWSATTSVRGGEIGETLIRLDGLRLYDPFHLRDFQSVFSAIDPGIVRSMDVYTGGFPASFGERMSGVIDVETIPASSELSHELGLSFFNSSFLSSGNFADEKGQWVASIRRSNLDILYDRFSEQTERPRYTDVFTKLSFDLSDRIRLTGSLLRLEDDISLSDDVDREERASARQLDTYAWLRLDHSINGRLSGSTLLARSMLESDRRGSSAKAGVSRGSLTDVRSFAFDTIQSEWSRVIGARMLLEFGGSITLSDGAYRYQDQAIFDLLFDVEGAPDQESRNRSIFASPDGRQVDLFTSLRLDWTPALTTEFGIRWNRTTTGQRKARTLDPRFGVRYSLTERSSVRASLGRFHQPQAINELQVNDGVTTFFAPQRADQIVVGFDHSVSAGIELRVEAYDKSISDLRPRFENLLNTRVLLPELKPDRIEVAPTAARGRGIEFGVDGELGNYRWWGSLSLAHVRDRIGDVEVPRSWDQARAVSAGFIWAGPKWNVSSALAYRSGWPTTPVALDSTADAPTAVALGRNSERLGAFGSLDLRVSRRIELEQSELMLSLEFANLTNRANPCCFEYEIGDEEETGLLVLDQLNYLPTIPSLGVVWKF